MGAFARCSSRAPILLLGCATLTAGCVEELAPIEGTQSLRVELTSPVELGSAEEPLDESVREVAATVTAIDHDNLTDADFAGLIDIYVHFLGGLTPEIGTFDRLAQVQLVDGVGTVTVDLPPVFGPTFLWAQHSDSDGDGFDDPDATYATGTSPTLWFRQPYLADVSRPEDEEALDALERSALTDKHINVVASRYGDRGRLVVTGVYAQGYTL